MSRRPGRYVVVGAGAVGATVAAQLHDADRDVVLVARGAHLAALRADGLTYVRPEGSRVLRLPVVGGPQELTLQEGDVLVLATKSQDTEGVLQDWAWQPVGAGSTAGTAAGRLPVLLLQNGLENARAALRRFRVVLDAVVMIPSSHVRPGEVVAPASPKAGAFYLGVAGPAHASAAEAAEAVAADLVAASFAVQVVPEIERWKAAKLLGNIAYNADALYPPSDLRTEAETRIRDEGLAALRAAGIEPVDLQAASTLDLSEIQAVAIPGHERGGSSTWQSLARGGSVESDFLNGEVVLLARLHGLEAPVNAGVQERLGAAARSGAAPGTLGEDDLAELLGQRLSQAPSDSSILATLRGN